jgi:DNA replication and repair protein RecF
VRLGLERGTRTWHARRNGADLPQLSDLAESLAVVVLEPNSHLLISGAPEVRRRYLDWGVFHVEPAYLDAWRRYARALRQRIAALRAGAHSVLSGLESVLAPAGEAMTGMRKAYVSEVADHLAVLAPELSPNLGDVSISYQQGWASGSLAEALTEHRDRDRERGSTQFGPHRADLVVRVAAHSVRDSASRGEQKILATARVLAQGRRQCETGRKPVLLLDDLASEFDRAHFAAALEAGRALGVQMWISGVEPVDPGVPCATFHVEHGQVRKLV